MTIAHIPTTPKHVTRILASLAMLVCVSALGCSPKNDGNGPTPQSPERQSDAEYDVARDLFSRGNPRASLDHILKACELNDENDKALYFASIVYLSFCATDRQLAAPDCKLERSEKYARLALKANGSYRDAKNLLGQVLIDEAKYAEAIEILTPLTQDPAYVEGYLAWGNLGWAEVLSGRVDDGITALRNAVTQPRFCVGHYRLGVAYEKKNDLAQAEKSYSDALDVEVPECQKLQDAWDARARVRMRLGKLDDAKKDFEKCRDLSDKTKTGQACVQTLATLGTGGRS